MAGATRPTTPSSGSTRCRRSARRNSSRSCSGTIPASRRSSSASSSAPRATRSSWRRASAPWSRPGYWRVSGGPIAWRSRCRAFRCRRRCRRSWRHVSTGCHRTRSASCRPQRSSARRCPWRSSRPSPKCLEELLRLGLTHLQAAEFLYETRLFPEIEYTFKHALTHQVAYESAPTGAAAGAACPHCRGPGGAAPETGSSSRSNAWPTMPCGARCGTRPWHTAGRRGRRPWRGRPTARPSGHFEQALSALQHLPETRDTREQAVDLRLALRSALWPSGNLGRILALLREAETLAEALDDPRRLAQVSLLSVREFPLHGCV